MGPENVKEQRPARGKWACVYLTENLSGFEVGRGLGELRRAGDGVYWNEMCVAFLGALGEVG